MTYAFPYVLFISSFFIFQYLPKAIGRTEQYYYPRLYVLFSLLIFLGCRGFIATDWISYYPFYQETPSIFNDKAFNFIQSWPWEKGFLLLTCVIKSFAPNFFAYQFVLFAIDLIIIDKIICEYVDSKYYVIAYISFFVFQGFVMEVNLLRNAQAIMLFLLSIKYVREKKIFKYILLNCFGVLFHTSSVFYLPLYFVLNHRFSKKFLLIAFFLGNIIMLAHISWLTGLLQNILPMLGQSRLASMITSYQILTGKANATSLGFGFIERTGIYLIALHFQPLFFKRNEKILPFLNMQYFFCFTYLYLSEFFIFTQRISMLFTFSYWIVLPAIYGKLRSDGKKIFLLFFILYCVLKMLVQCDEPIFKYRNALFDENNYIQCTAIFNKNAVEIKK